MAGTLENVIPEAITLQIIQRWMIQDSKSCTTGIRYEAEHPG